VPKPALLTGITSVRNRGVEALVATIAVELRRRRPDLSIAVLGRGSDQDVPRLDALGVRLAAAPFTPERILQALREQPAS